MMIDEREEKKNRNEAVNLTTLIGLMSIGTFCMMITIVSLTVIDSGMCFRCYVCDSRSDKNCNEKPNRIAKCRNTTPGCVKIINNALEYKFFNSNGTEIEPSDWDGTDTDWQPISYVERVLIRRCGDNYARYKPLPECKQIPAINYDDDDDRSDDIICYCKHELCNDATKINDTEQFFTLYLVYVAFLLPFYFSQIK